MSHRNDTGATYDHTLLSNLPDPTRAEKQEGYNLDLLDEGRAPAPPPEGPPPVQHGATDGYSPEVYRKEGQPENGDREDVIVKVPWYRTRWGITAIVIAIIVIIGAAVGGAVGGTHHSSHSQANDVNNSTGSDSNGSSSSSSSSTATTAGIVPNTPRQSTSSNSTSTPGADEEPGQASRSTQIPPFTVPGSSPTQTSVPAATTTEPATANTPQPANRPT